MSKRFAVLIVGIGVCLIASACDRLTAGLSGKPEDRFELRQDNQGRLIRLDKTTGEIVIVDGTRLIPVPKGRSNDSKFKSTAASPLPGLADDSHDRPAPIQPNSQIAAGDDSASPSSDVAIITTTANAPVFATADRKGGAIVLAAKGSRFRVVGEYSDSYLITFPDAQVGHRTGYVEKKLAKAEPSVSSAAERVNESTPEAKPRVPDPIDVSIALDRQESTVTIVVDAPIFQASSEGLAPLNIAKAGSVVRLIKQDENWCTIEFQDPAFGLRSGYIRTRFLWLPTRNLSR